MEKLNRYIKYKNKCLVESEHTMQSLFGIIHDQNDRIFYEYLENFKVREVSYADFAEYVCKTASFLKGKLVTETGSFVAVFMKDSPNYLAVFWGLLMSGYKPLLLNVRLSSETNRKVLEMCNCNAVVADCDVSLLGVSVVDFPQGTGLCSEILSCEKLDVPNWQDVCAISSTATTMNVKVCLYSGYDITEQALNTKGILAINKQIKTHYQQRLKLLTFLPFYHVFGLFAVYFWFSIFGRTFVHLSDFDSKTIVNTIKRHNVTHIFAVPLFWNAVYKEIVSAVNKRGEKTVKRFNKGIKLGYGLQKVFPHLGMALSKKLFDEVRTNSLGKSVKFMISGGGSLPLDVLKTFNAMGYPLYNGYGATEIGITSVELRQNVKARSQGFVGKPFDTVKYKIADNVLWVKGSSLSSEIRTASGVTRVDKNEWFCTNDVACVEKGNYKVLGRADDVFVSENGEKINPDSLENAVKLTSCQAFCVLGLNHGGKERLVLIVQVKPDGNLLYKRQVNDELLTQVKQLARFNVQPDCIFVTTSNLCETGDIKVSRQKLKAKIASGQLNLIPLGDFATDKLSDESQVQSSVFADVKQVLSDVLGKPCSTIGDDAHFMYDLGGTSLDYVNVLVGLESKFGKRLDISQKTPLTVREFATVLMNTKEGENR